MSAIRAENGRPSLPKVTLTETWVRRATVPIPYTCRLDRMT